MRKLVFIIVTIALISCNNSTSSEVASTDSNSSAPPISLVIHGGAGNIQKENMDPAKEKAIRAKMEEALEKGYQVLKNGGTSVDAVVASIQVLEESTYFNAGKGAVFTNQGKNELDASIMNGETGAAGAVAGVSTIKSPIAGARAVMEESVHVMMAGEGAALFAKEQGLEIVQPSYFRVEERFEQLQRILKKESSNKKKDTTKASLGDEKFGTVGCVALDKYGNLAAGTSTGGMTNKKFGRIGDSPIIGAGTFAENASCGVSATGHGEYFIRNVVAYDIAALMKYKDMSVEDAAEHVIMDKLVEKDGDGGVIAMDAKGNIAMPFNTPGMYRGYINEEKKAVVRIYREE